jgi:type I restriction enzyme, R subunit
MVEPEAEARQKIDEMLTESGWVIQDYDQRNLSEGLGVAVREYPTSDGPADYALFVDGVVVGVVEAKKFGVTLSGVVDQSERYLDGLYEKFSDLKQKPPFSYETTGIKTKFADRRDPDYRSRYVFTFHRPEQLKKWLEDDVTLRGRLRLIPKLDYPKLRECQIDAIIGLEESFAKNNPRALIQMATGAGKTFAAVTSIYRLLKFAKAKRVLFLVDRNNLGIQAKKEFQNYKIPNDGRAFTDIYNLQPLQSHTIDPACEVVISTIQRMYSILKGEKEFDEEKEQFSSFEDPTDEEPKYVDYNENVPIGEFDFIVIDECHRSIYTKWRQVIEYFDAFLIGLTATPSDRTLGFFRRNEVSRYTHEQAVIDNVNVTYQTYQLRTKHTEQGLTIEAGALVEKRDRLTRQSELEYLKEDESFGAKDLDNSVVSKDTIRLIIRTFKQKLESGEIFPRRVEVPKTLIFAKDDSHAEDITEIILEEFGRGNDFCKKITYKTQENSEELIKSFRRDPLPRIAVSVDMIATGTDIRPLEIIIFMRDVRSQLYFDQMKGRGTRIIKPKDLKSVTPDAQAKTHFVIIDAVGVCKSRKSSMVSLSKNPGVAFKVLLDKAVDRNANTEVIESLIYRLSRLNNKLDEKDQDEIKQAADGKTLHDIQKILLDGIDADKREEKAKEKFKTETPTREQIQTVSKEMINDACKVFDSAVLRKTILDVKSKSEQIVDDISIDELLEFGQIKQVHDLDKKAVEKWSEFLDENKDKIKALEIIYSFPYKMKEIVFSDIKELANAIEKPPYNLTPELLWDAYERLDKSKVKPNPENMLTDLISIIRFSSGKQDVLLPFSELISEKFEKWLVTQESSGRKFTPEQKEWLVMIKDTIASDVSISLDSLDGVPFNQKGGRVKFYEIFRDDYENILKELHEVLINS